MTSRPKGSSRGTALLSLILSTISSWVENVPLRPPDYPGKENRYPLGGPESWSGRGRRTLGRLAPSTSTPPPPGPSFQGSWTQLQDVGSRFFRHINDLLLVCMAASSPGNRSAIRHRRYQKLKFHSLKCLCEASSRFTALKSNLTGTWHTHFCCSLFL
jgi:hypothetical protein